MYRRGRQTAAAATAATSFAVQAAAVPSAADAHPSIDPPRWTPSVRHRGLLVPRFFDCEGDSWNPTWKTFRGLLQSEQPADLLRAGRAPSAQLALLADELVAASSDEQTHRGYHLFARRIARDLGFAKQEPAVSSAAYDEQTAASDGFVSDTALEGFCLYGLVAALFVKALHALAIAGTIAADAVRDGTDESNATEIAMAVFEKAAKNALAHLTIALSLIGPRLGLDFMESSSWMVHSSDMRTLVECLQLVLQTNLSSRIEPGGASGRTCACWPSDKSSWERGSAWSQPALEAPSRLKPPADMHLAIALATPGHPAVPRMPESEEKASAMLWNCLAARFLTSSSWEEAVDPVLSVAGLGDHATATLDAALMVQRAVHSIAPGVSVRMALHGLACPAEVAGRHHCRLRCHVLGIPCAPTTDPLAEWLGRYVMENEGGYSYAMDGDAASSALAAALVGLGEALAAADLLVCSHPVAMCLLAFAFLWRGPPAEDGSVSGALQPKPMLLHLASTLLYGAPGCSECVGRLRRYDSKAAEDYMSLARELMTGPLPLFPIAEGAVLSAQLQLQLEVTVPSIPALALYLDDRSRWFGRNGKEPIGEKRRTVLVTRARLFAHPTGFFLRCLLQEIAISNGPVADAARGHFWFAESLGQTEGEEPQHDAWKSWDEMASCQAAFFIPSDIHQRTFVELYRLHVPIFMPDVNWLLKLPAIAPFGTFAYHGALPASLLGKSGSQRTPADQDGSDGRMLPPAFFDPDDVAAVRAVHYWYHYSDYAHFPHVERCSSIPDLLIRLASGDFTETAKRMRQHYELLVRGATVAFSQGLAMLLTT